LGYSTVDGTLWGVMNEVYTTRDITEQAAKRGRPVTDGYVRRLFRKGRIDGAYKIAGAWVVPVRIAEQWLVKWTTRGE